MSTKENDIFLEHQMEIKEEHSYDCATNATEVDDGFASLGCTCKGSQISLNSPGEIDAGLARKLNKQFYRKCDKPTCYTRPKVSRT